MSYRPPTTPEQEAKLILLGFKVDTHLDQTGKSVPIPNNWTRGLVTLFAYARSELPELRGRIERVAINRVTNFGKGEGLLDSAYTFAACKPYAYRVATIDEAIQIIIDNDPGGVDYMRRSSHDDE